MYGQIWGGAKGRIETRERLALKKVGRGTTFRDIRKVQRRGWNANVFARPNGLRGKADTAISCRGPGPATTKKEVYQQSGGGGGCTDVPLWRSKREMRPCGKVNNTVGEGEMHKEERDVLEVEYRRMCYGEVWYTRQ